MPLKPPALDEDDPKGSAMFGFFKKKPPKDQPTDNQIRYAKRLGIPISPAMGREDVSAAIGAAERANPRLEEDRERAKSKARERKFGPEVVSEEAGWNQFSESTEYMLAIYRHRKEIVVDVLRVNEATINERGKLILGVAAPKLTKDRELGDYLEWERDFDLPREALLLHENLHSAFHDDGIDAYRRVVKKGLKRAHELDRASK